MTKPEAAQVVADHEEGLSSYWLLVTFKLYAYWWGFAFAYFSGEVPIVQINDQDADVLHVKQCSDV